MAKILISDKYTDDGVATLTNHPGFEVDVKVGMSPDELKACIGNYDALLVRSATKPNADILSAATKLKLIVRGGEGTDNIDKAYAAEKGIIVENTPGQNSHAVAELTIGHMFALARHIPQASQSTKGGKWEKKKLKGTELKGKTLGLVGAGKIGGDVGRMAQALGMKVICYEVMEGDIGFERADLKDVIAQADYLSIHVPLLDATRDLIGAEQLGTMKKSAYLINCARGGIVNEQALADAVSNSTIAGAAVDVYTTEPVPADSPLLGVPGIICTPHLGASSQEAQDNCSTAAAAQVIAYFDNGEVLNKVN